MVVTHPVIRYCNLRFTSKTSAMIHGFGGYFDAWLYKDINISINPATFSAGMFSWFPLYIPIRVRCTWKLLLS